MKNLDKENPSKEAQCFFKCVGESSGIIKDGAINEDVIRYLVANGHATADCLEGDTKIENCEDMMKMEPCFSNIKTDEE